MPFPRFVLPLAVAVLALGLPALAQDQPAFKRLSVPKPGQPPKIDVQIDPDAYFRWFNPDPADAAPAATRDAAAVLPAPASLPYAGFWDSVGPATGPVSMDRIEDALRETGLPGPRLSEVQALADRFGRQIMLTTVDTRVSPALVLAVMLTESGGRTDAVSSAGAQGLMQLIPATADRFGVNDALRPDQNIRGGVAYLDWLMAEFGGNPVNVLAAYNAGENSVRDNGGAPPFAETRAYVPKVLAAWSVARGLCLTPPDLISDPCVLKLGERAGEG